jgi:hypothetical protein
MQKWGETGLFKKPKISSQKLDRSKSIVVGNMIHRIMTQNYYNLDNYDTIFLELRKKMTCSIN